MNARTEWISMYTESAGAAYNAEREGLKRAAMLLHALSSEFERIRKNFTEDLNGFRARLECDEVRVDSKGTGKDGSLVVDVVSKENSLKKSYMSPDLFVSDSPDITVTLKKPPGVVPLKTGPNDVEVLKSPKLNRTQRRTNRRRQNADDRYPKLVADVETPAERAVAPTPTEDVVESTPEPVWRKPLKVVQTVTPTRKVGAGKRRKVQTHTLTQMFAPPDSKSPDATLVDLVDSPPSDERDEDWNFITHLLKKNENQPKTSLLLNRKTSTNSGVDLHERSTQRLSDDSPNNNKTTKQAEEAPNATIDEEYNRRQMKKDFEDYIKSCERRPRPHIFAMNQEYDEEEEKSPQVYHKTFTEHLQTLQPYDSISNEMDGSVRKKTSNVGTLLRLSQTFSPSGQVSVVEEN